MRTEAQKQRRRESERLRRARSRDSINAYQQKWRANNPDKVKAHSKTQRARNGDKMNASTQRWRDLNPEKVKDYNDRKYAENPERMRQISRDFYHKNTPACKSYQKKWRDKNQGYLSEKRRLYSKTHRPQKNAYVAQRYANDIAYRVLCCLRGNLACKLKRARAGKVANTMNLLGCSMDDFLIYIESQFEPGWNWDNYGKVWVLDHHMPCAAFDLTNPDHQKRAFHFSNLRPLGALDNLKKSDKVPDNFSTEAVQTIQ